MGSAPLRLVLATGAITWLVLAGCGPGDVPSVAPVTGVVTLDGKPLEGAVLTFEPETSRQSSARTDAQGKDQLSFNQPLKGAALGKHIVRISKRGDPSKGPNLDEIPEKYNRRSELTAEVKSGENHIDFELNSN